MKVIHIINDLRRGGAETALSRLALHMKQQGDSPVIVCLMQDGELAASVRQAGAPVHSLGMKRGSIRPADLLRLAQLIRRENPDIVQTWMYHPNLLGGIAAKLVRPRIPVLWGIRHSILHQSSSRRSTVLVSRFCALLSKFLPTRIVYCGTNPRVTHEAVGYNPSRGTVIPNGISMDQFAPDAETRHRVRAELGIGDDQILIGIAARFHPDKDLPTFVRAAGHLARVRQDVHFLMCGTAVDDTNDALMAEIDATGSRERFHLLGERSDVPQLLTGLDIAALSSITEGFPNAILEAMSTGVPCVGTDVGDTAELIGATGRIVPPSRPGELASALDALISLPREQLIALGKAARQRVRDRYRLEVTGERYRDLYRDLIH